MQKKYDAIVVGSDDASENEIMSVLRLIETRLEHAADALEVVAQHRES